ncbi:MULTISPECIES: transaldolase [unclassified Acinetobacter]|uniref:transaldolase n=1 Tax=unclassified Acinetobacter TaxID=196816 RepID=UPI0035B9BBBB
MSTNSLLQLQKYTTLVVDSSDLQAIARFRPLDATTNPSLITAAASQSENIALLEDALQQARAENYQADALVERVIDILTVRFGVEILKLIQGRVSTEVDASLSYDTEATIEKALQLIELYKQFGIDQSRVLIKIAATWQGIQAARFLEQQGIQCNLTLVFNLTQAQACADAGVYLISPFVGRILDWYKKAEQKDSYVIEQDPGVLSVKRIYQYYKQNDIQTKVMGASFRSSAQILALAGCDLLTIAPNLVAELEQSQAPVSCQLNAEDAKTQAKIQRPVLNQQIFEQEVQDDLMAAQLLQGGIDGFIKAREQLAQLLHQSFGLADIAP